MNIETNAKAEWIEPKIEELHVNETAGLPGGGSDTPPSGSPSLTRS